MMRVAVDIPGVEAWFDLRSESWKIQYNDETFVLRYWNWGERYRLVCRSIADGRFDRRRFVDSVFSELMDRAPEKDRIVLADTVLELLGVPRRQPDCSLAHGEFLLARAFGWRPSQLSGEPVASLDEMIQRLVQEEQRRNAPSKRWEDEGWTSIVFQPPPSDPSSRNESGPTPEVIEREPLSKIRLQEKLDTAAAWAGEAVDWPEREDGRLFGCEVVPGIVHAAAQTTGHTEKKHTDGTLDSGGESFSKNTASRNEHAEKKDNTSTFYRGIARLKTDPRQSGRKADDLGEDRHAPSHARVRLSRPQQAKPRSESAEEASTNLKKAFSIMPTPSGSSRESTFRTPQEEAGPAGPNHFQSQSDVMAEPTPANLSEAGRGRTEKGNLAHAMTTRLAGLGHVKPNAGREASPVSGILHMPAEDLRPPKRPEVPGRPPVAPHDRNPGFPVVQDAPAMKKAGLAGFSARPTAADGRGLPERAFLSETARHPKVRSASASKPKGIFPHAETLEPAWAGNPFESTESRPAVEASHPFALSELEEHMADVLERAAREAGVDLP